MKKRKKLKPAALTEILKKLDAFEYGKVGDDIKAQKYGEELVKEHGIEIISDLARHRDALVNTPPMPEGDICPGKYVALGPWMSGDDDKDAHPLRGRFFGCVVKVGGFTQDLKFIIWGGGIMRWPVRLCHKVD